LNATAPTFTRAGTRSRKRSAALVTAAHRLGATSVARIDPERSVARTTVACSAGTAIVASGRASAIASAASATP
jgi:hypothetical protein